MTSQDGSHQRVLAAGLVAFGVLALSVGGVIVAWSTAAAGATADDAGTPGSGDAVPETDNTVTLIEVRPDGTARWQTRVRTRLRSDADVAAYEAFQERFRANRSASIEQFRTSMERIVADASTATGRDMAATDFAASTTIRSVPRRWGIVTYSFTWEGFAGTDGQRLRVGDAFESGFFIAANDTLQLRAPEGYGLASVSPQPDERENGTAVWMGRVDFGTGEPAATLVPAGGESGTGDSGIGLLAGLLVVTAGAVLVGGGAVWYRRRPTGSATTERGGQPTDGTTAATTATPDTAEPVTDDERIRRVVSRNGGRMKQADIVDELDWSKSKVSRVLGDLAEEGVVEKTRIGRENVISLVEGGHGGPGDD